MEDRIERLYFDLEYNQGGRVVEGTAVRYGDKAAYRMPGGIYYDTIRPGALKINDVTLNVQHQRKRLIGRTNGGGLSFQDSPERLRVKAEFEGQLTRDAADALAMLETRLLRAWSLEIGITESHLDQANRTRVITGANVTGIALVDRPAFAGSEAVLREFEEYQGGFEGSYSYNTDEITSDSGEVRKRRVRPRAFRHSLSQPASEREIVLQIGNSPGQILASRQAGTLILDDTDKALSFSVKGALPATSYVSDMEAQLAAGLTLSVAPLYRIPPADVVPNATELIPEPGSNEGVQIEVVNEAVLYAISVRARSPVGSESEVSLWQSVHGLTVY